MKSEAMFYFALAQILQIGLPVPVLTEIVGDMFGYEDVAGVSTIEHALSDVNTCSGNIDAVVHVGDLVDGPLEFPDGF